MSLRSNFNISIWRRFLIPTSSTFAQLHKAIQLTFGWGDYHLWDFREPGRTGETIAGIPIDEGWGPPTPDAAKVKVKAYFEGPHARQTCIYRYDFGMIGLMR